MCPAADSSNPKAVIDEISNVKDSGSLIQKLKEYPPCVSAGMIENCSDCKFQHLCRGEFCGNCIYMKSTSTNAVKYMCEIYSHHFTSIENAHVGDAFDG